MNPGLLHPKAGQRLPHSSPQAVPEVPFGRCQAPHKACAAVRWQRRRATSCAKALAGVGKEKKKRQENKIITHAEQPFLAGLLAVKNLLVCPETAPEHPKNDREEPSRRLLCQLLAWGEWAFLLPLHFPGKPKKQQPISLDTEANTFEDLLLLK